MSGSWIGGQNSFHPCEDDAYKMSCRRVGAHNGRSRRRRGRRLLECSGVLLRVSAAGRRPRHHRSVERSTTRTNWLDGVETEWTNRTSEDPPDPMGQRPPPCQGEGRGFEVRLPLQQSTWSAAKNAVAASRPVAPVFSSSLGSAEAWSCRYWSLPCRTRFRAPRWGRPRQLRRSSGPSGERSGRWSSVPSLRDRLIAQLKVGATSADLKLVSGSNVTANPAQIAHLPAAQRTSVVKRLQSPGTGS
jgi:hypothetical protein